MKRNLRKYLSGMLSALLFVACILTPVNAHASSGLAVSAGKNIGEGVDTRQNAIFYLVMAMQMFLVLEHTR